MEKICCPELLPLPHLKRTDTPSPPFKVQRVQSARRCCLASPENENRTKTPTPPLLRLAVSGVTELLRLFPSSTTKHSSSSSRDRDGISVSDVDDVLRIIQSDYENSYFVTGNFTCAIYADDCIFEDPTIKFRGKDLYARNLKLLVPFFDRPSISLQKIDKVESNFVLATWRLRTFLKLPWKPLILIDGSTLYELDDTFTIVRHCESWNVSALEAIGQIFTPTN